MTPDAPIKGSIRLVVFGGRDLDPMQVFDWLKINAAPRTIKAMIPIVATQSLPSTLDTIEAQAAEIELLQKRLREQFDVSAKAIEKQQRRIEGLEAALKPFADMGWD